MQGFIIIRNDKSTLRCVQHYNTRGVEVEPWSEAMQACQMERQIAQKAQRLDAGVYKLSVVRYGSTVSSEIGVKVDPSAVIATLDARIAKTGRPAWSERPGVKGYQEAVRASEGSQQNARSRNQTHRDFLAGWERR